MTLRFTARSESAIMAPVEVQSASMCDAREEQPLRIVVGENNADLAMTLTMLLNDEPDMQCVDTEIGRAHV